MKIYFIGQKGIPAIYGGVEKHAEELARRLARAGHEVYVYTRPNYTLAKLKKWQGVNLISLPSVATKHLDAISHTFLACLDVARRREVDVIHFHSIGPSSLIWLMKLLKPGVPIISTFHCQDYYHQKWGILARLYLKFGELMSCRLADSAITVSKSLQKYVLKTYKKIADYLPNGVSLPKIMAAKEISKWGLSRGNYILAVSRLIPHKGLHFLIEAHKNSRTAKKLVIAGDGTYTDSYVNYLKELAAEDKRIIFTGNQTGRTLAELFSNAYLFVQPSLSEGLSIALLEAMSYGRAILASDIPENKEAIGRAGLTFKSGAVKDLEKKLAYLLKRPVLAKQLGRQGYDRVKNEYGWSDIAKGTIKLYKKAIALKEAKRAPKAGLVRRFIGLF